MHEQVESVRVALDHHFSQLGDNVGVRIGGPGSALKRTRISAGAVGETGCGLFVLLLVVRRVSSKYETDQHAGMTERNLDQSIKPWYFRLKGQGNAIP